MCLAAFPSTEHSWNLLPVHHTSQPVKRFAELEIPDSAMQNHMKVDLNLQPYRLMFVRELTDNDTYYGQTAHVRMISTFNIIPKHDKIVFNDE